MILGLYYCYVHGHAGLGKNVYNGNSEEVQPQTCQGSTMCAACNMSVVQTDRWEKKPACGGGKQQ